MKKNYDELLWKLKRQNISTAIDMFLSEWDGKETSGRKLYDDFIRFVGEEWRADISNLAFSIYVTKTGIKKKRTNKGIIYYIAKTEEKYD